MDSCYQALLMAFASTLCQISNVCYRSRWSPSASYQMNKIAGCTCASNARNIFNVDKQSLQHFRVVSMSNRCRSDGLCYLGIQLRSSRCRWSNHHGSLSLTWIILNPNIANSNSFTVEVWEWISDFTPHFIIDMITYIISPTGITVNPCQ